MSRTDNVQTYIHAFLIYAISYTVKKVCKKPVIIKLSPKSYDELYKIITYIVFNYLGYEVENPNLGLKKLREFTNYIGISKVQVDYYIENVKRNVGGIPNLQIAIPDSYKTRPGEIHTLGVTQFAKRLYYAC